MELRAPRATFGDLDAPPATVSRRLCSSNSSPPGPAMEAAGRMFCENTTRSMIAAAKIANPFMAHDRSNLVVGGDAATRAPSSSPPRYSTDIHLPPYPASSAFENLEPGALGGRGTRRGW